MHNTNKLKLRLRLAQFVKNLLSVSRLSRTFVRVTVGEKAHYNKILRYAEYSTNYGVTLKMHNTNKLKLRLRLAQFVKNLLSVSRLSRTFVRVTVGEKAHYNKILRYAKCYRKPVYETVGADVDSPIRGNVAERQKGNGVAVTSSAREVRTDEKRWEKGLAYRYHKSMGRKFLTARKGQNYGHFQ